MSWLWVDSGQWSWLLQAVARIEMAAIDDALATLTTQVQANTDTEASAVTLIQGLAVLIQQNAADPAAVNALAAKLKASADALGAAVTANTPAA
jgi:hypothetical protein